MKLSESELPKIELASKPTYLKLAEDIDFLDLFRRLEEDYENCFLLESLGEETETSRHSVIGFDPEAIISARGNDFFYNNVAYEVSNPYETLQKITPQNVIARNYAGGLIGYMSYEAINFFEPRLNVKVHPDFPQFMFGVYTDGLVYDKITGEIFYFFYKKDRSKLIQEYLLHVEKRHITQTKVSLLGDTLSQSEHAEIVKDTIEEIKKGNTFECEVGFKRKYQISGATFPLYEELRKVNPSPHMYYMKFGEKKIIGASPELLLRLRDGELESFPLAGTVRRGANPDEDRQLARQLLNDPKELAEHKMLVDLHRNDLGRIARFGTVKVRALMEIKKFSHVQHISSEVVGIIDPKYDMFDALRCVLPAGTLSGAPKIESMKIIDRHESEARGPYGGALGQFSFNGDCTFAIPIRTLFIAGEQGYAQASGGIVYDSIAKNEYEEIQRKLGAIDKVMEKFS